MARGKVTTTKELQASNDKLTGKLKHATKRLDSTLTRIGGLRAHLVANNPSNEDVVRIIDSIIAES